MPQTSQRHSKTCVGCFFKQQYVSDTQVLHTNPNNAGIESDPITRISDNKRIGYKAKYFENSIGYSQIRDSMEKAVKYYSGQVDVILLYCNKSISGSKRNKEKVTLNKDATLYNCPHYELCVQTTSPDFLADMRNIVPDHSADKANE